ncbi:hypothetical protein OK349_17760 [Sphingomonas sp. BT-65]|uniref:hypothetical protein n=1 Tax=Sphingomonas sp. BT-65 TaxID=2989821 RepID=UPI0022354D62|nr:hypothetical protein [Sphingomonas sp. BT-65]MCW4463557.1 hypothetical protein [Sphingomonas sp. BT-65]
MNMDLDEALGRLSAAPVPPGLAEIEDKVFARVREEAAFATQRLRVGAVAVIAALGLGFAAGSPVTAAASPNTLSPFGPSSPLAPSTLLAAD